MSSGPVGRWEVDVDPLGTGPTCHHALVVVECRTDGGVEVTRPTGGPLLSGSWHRAGEGRIVVRAVAPRPVAEAATGLSVEAAVELSADGSSMAGRALARIADPTPAGATRSDVVVVAVDLTARRAP